jgi:translation initiation factor 5B
MRVRNAYRTFKTVYAANGIKIAARDLDKAVAGLPMFVAEKPADIDALKTQVYLYGVSGRGEKSVL